MQRQTDRTTTNEISGGVPLADNVYDLGTTSLRWKDLNVAGTATITTANITNLTTTTHTVTNDLDVKDALVTLAKGNGSVGDTKNIGTLCEYKSGANPAFAGLCRNSGDSKFYLFKDAASVVESTDLTTLLKAVLKLEDAYVNYLFANNVRPNTGTSFDIRNSTDGLIVKFNDSKVVDFQATITVLGTSNQIVLGTTNTTTIHSPAPGSARTVTIPLVGASADFVMTEGSQTVNGAKTLTGTLTLTTVSATQIVATNLSQQLVPLNYTKPSLGDAVVQRATDGSIEGHILKAINTSNQIVLGTTNTTTVTSPAPGSNRTVTIPLVGANADFIMSEGAQTMNGIKTFGTSLKLPTSGGTAAELNFYEEYTATVTFTGIWATGQSTTLRIYRIGRIATLTVGYVSATANTPGTPVATGVVPTRFLPLTTGTDLSLNQGGVITKDNGTTYTDGICYLPTNGDITIYRTSVFGTFTGTGASGWFNFATSYVVA